MSTRIGAPKKEVSFPIASVIFRKDELGVIISTLAQHISSALKPFGKSSHFELRLSLEVHRRNRKGKPCNTKPKKAQTPTPPKPGTLVGV